MTRTRRIVGVCLYGCDLNSPLRPYLNKVAEFCRQWRPDAIMLSGGPTQQKSFPGKTEELVAYWHLVKALDDLDNYHPAWFGNADAFTTYDNIAGIADDINTYLTPHEQPETVLFCEVTRGLKVAILARYFLGFPPAKGLPPIRIMTDSWELMHPLKELIGTLEAVAAIYLPFFNTIQRFWRIRKSKNR